MAEGTYGGQCIEKHTAFIYDRGGRRRVASLVDISSLRWERTRDGISEASLRIEGRACAEQKQDLKGLRTHRHELVIFRGRRRVWEGPLHRIAWGKDFVDIVAHDVFEYVMNTPLTRTWSNAHPNPGIVTTRIGNILRHELTTGRSQIENGEIVLVPAWEDITPPANIVDHIEIHHFVNEVSTSQVTYPYQMTVGEHIKSLARYNGIDYTVIGRAIHVWDVSRALGRTAPLSEENFPGGVIVTEYGADHAQSAYVLGNPPEGSNVPVYGQAVRQENLDYYGPWTKIFTPYNEDGSEQPTEGELNSQAARNLSGRTPAPVEVRIPDNSTVLLSDAISIEELVPGVQIPLRATLAAREYSQMQKIDHIVVTETSEGENIALTLVPITKQDADEELPEPESKVSGTFPGDGNYRMDVSASARGTSYVVKATVTKTGGGGVAGTNQPWSAQLERTPSANVNRSGDWDFKFQYYTRKVVMTAQVNDAAAGFRDFSVTVSMGPGVGELTLSGTVEV